MGAQADSLGYVPDPVAGSQRNTIDPQILMMDCPPPFDITEADEGFPLFLTQGILPSGNLDTGHLSTDLWNHVQGHYTDGNNPD